MQAYQNDPAIKADCLARVKASQSIDEIVPGKGCALGCNLRDHHHSAYELELGIPVMLTRLENAFFEGLPIERARVWPAQFLDAAPVGADLSRVGWQFLQWLLTESGIGAFDHPAVADSVQYVARMIKPAVTGDPIEIDIATTRDAAESAWGAHERSWAAPESSEAWSAWSAARSAWCAAETGWNSARSAAKIASRNPDEAADIRGWSAVRSAARSAAESAAESARCAAESAAESAADSPDAAWSAAYGTMADKLLSLMAAAAQTE